MPPTRGAVLVVVWLACLGWGESVMCSFMATYPMIYQGQTTANGENCGCKSLARSGPDRKKKSVDYGYASLALPGGTPPKGVHLIYIP